MRRTTIAFPAALLAAGLALTGCSAGSMTTTDTVELRDGGVVAPEAVDGAVGLESEAVVPEAVDRSVITTGWVTVVVDDPIAAATDAVRITEAAGGRVDARSETAPIDGDNGSATLTLRIPSERLTAALDELRELGEVREVSLNASDVTTQTQDLQARIGALQASVDRLLALVGTATDTEALIALETALSERQAELESLQAQQRYLDDQVAMSTITLSLPSTSQAPIREPDTFWSGLLAGLASMGAFFSALVVALGVLLPWLALAAIITAIVILIVKRRRRRAAPAAEAGTAPVEPVESERP